MRSITQKLFGASRRARLLAVAFLFVVANMVSTLGVFVPSASAAPVWEEVVSVANDDKIHVNGFLPFGVMDNSGKLTPYTSFKVEFTYRDESQGAVNSLYMTKVGVDTLYDHIAATKGDVGTYALNTDGAEHTVTSAEFSVGGYPNMRLWLSHGTGNASDYNNPNPYVVITSHKLLGLRDSSIVTPAAPTLVAPIGGASVAYGDIQNDTAKFQYTPADGSVKTQVAMAGTFWNKHQNNEHVSASFNFTTARSGNELPISTFASTASTSYDYLPGKTYSWKARSTAYSGAILQSDIGWSEWTDVQTFTVTGSTGVTVPAAPTLVSPANLAQIDEGDIYDNTADTYLTYSPAANVESNHIRVTGVFDRGDGVGENVTVDMPSETNSIALEDFVPEDNGYTYIVGNTYTWSVRSSFSADISLEAAEGWSAWSEIRSFTVADEDAIVLDTPQLTAPANGATITSQTPTFTWGAVTGATGYSIQFSSSPEFLAGVGFETVDPTYTFETEIPLGTTSYWRVQAHNSTEGTESLWSGIWSFTVGDTNTVELPAAPTLVSPENGVLIDYADIHDSTAKIVFTPVDGVQTNHVQVSGLFKDSFGYEVLHTYNGTSAGELTFATAEGSFHDFIVGQTYTWRVRSSFANIPVNETNNPDWGAWSVLRSFTVVDGSSVPVFDVPTLISPDDNAATSNAAPTFTWGAVEGAGMYRLVVRPDALSSTFWECYTTSTSCSSLVPQNTTDTTLLPGRYYWYVEAHPSANPHADDPDGMHWVSSLDRAITITAGGDGNSGSGNTTTVSTGASPSPAGNTPAPNTPAPVDTTGEVLNEQDTAPSTAADEDQASERSNEATTSSDESNEDEDSKPFLLLGWWWAVIVAAGAAGSYGYIKSQKD